jgi:hypothetical protein
MTRVNLPETNWSADRVKVRVWYPARAIVVHQVTGHFSLPAARAVMTGIDRAIALYAPVDAFNDWYEMNGYDSDARLALTEFVLGSRTKYASIHILLKSKLVAMGVSVANLALGGMIVSYSDPRPWKEALHAAETKRNAADAGVPPLRSADSPARRELKR